jgi:hypothetical protein
MGMDGAGGGNENAIKMGPDPDDSVEVEADFTIRSSTLDH